MTTDIRLTSGDLCAITGIPFPSLDRWVKAGLLAPSNDGRGHGIHRTYSLMETFAVAAGVRYRAENAAPERVASVVRFLSRLTDEKLQAYFRDGKTYPVTDDLVRLAGVDEGLALPVGLLGWMTEAPYDDPTLDPAVAVRLKKVFGPGGRLYLPAIYEDVRRKAIEVQSRPRKKRGRPPKVRNQQV